MPLIRTCWASESLWLGPGLRRGGSADAGGVAALIHQEAVVVRCRCVSWCSARWRSPPRMSWAPSSATVCGTCRGGSRRRAAGRLCVGWLWIGLLDAGYLPVRFSGRSRCPTAYRRRHHRRRCPAITYDAGRDAVLHHQRRPGRAKDQRRFYTVRIDAVADNHRPASTGRRPALARHRRSCWCLWSAARGTPQHPEGTPSYPRPPAAAAVQRRRAKR